ncbi:MAG: hypothetical protein EOO56_01360 [Hymenobacter sp.]|nr:MAG: hypothetical protein EOO56_01360 [Hymenobacter sp.]
MPIPYRRLLPLLTLLFSARAGLAQTINTDAVTAYWKITEALRRNEPLTETTWQQFLALPANQIYTASIYDADALARYRQAMEVVYMPRYDSLRQAKVKAGSWFYVLLDNLKRQEPAYRTFTSETVRSPAFLESMYTYAYEYLPARAHVKHPDLHLYYTALGDDATSQQAGIVFSLYDAYSYQSVRPGILEAHELHHQLLGYALTPTENLTRPAPPGDEGLLYLLRMSLIEGLADLTDKRVQLTASSDSADIRRRYVQPAPAVIHRLDSTIRVQAAGGPATPLTFYRRLTNGSNGHLPGFYLAYTILRNGYLKPMLDHADDPIAFALLYQKAARKDKYHQHPPLFSTISMRYFKQLDRKYAKPRPAASKP